MVATTVKQEHSWEYGFRLRFPKLPKVRRPKIRRAAMELVGQVAGVVSVLVGVSYWSVPCAFILGGLTLIVAIERQE